MFAKHYNQIKPLSKEKKKKTLQDILTTTSVYKLW